jgi:putative peptidoglycan lipid II flippase
MATTFRTALPRLRLVTERFIPRGALLLSVLSVGYFAAGLVRNRVLANEFGAGPELDAYNAAFRIPEIAINVLVGAGLSAPFVPIFTRLLRGDGGSPDATRHAADVERAERFGQTVLTAAVLAMAVALVILFVGAPWLADTVFGGFDAETRALYIELLRINCLALLFFAASMAIGEVLVAHRRFLAYGVAPILYTSGIVVGAVVLGPRLGVAGAAWGAVGGAVAHLGARVIGVVRTGFRLRPRLAVRTGEFREFIRLMLPRMLSYPIDPVTTTYLTVLAVSVGPGTATALSFVQDYQFAPVQIIGISFSLAAFPILSAAWADGDATGFRRVLGRNVLIIGVLTTLAGIALAVLAVPLVERLLGGGKFDATAVALTAGLLVAFAISIPIDSLSYPLSRALYATHNTIWQVASSLAGLAALVIAAQVLVPAAGASGIAFAYAIGGAVKLVGLTLALVPRLRAMGRRDVPADADAGDAPAGAVSRAGPSEAPR